MREGVREGSRGGEVIEEGEVEGRSWRQGGGGGGCQGRMSEDGGGGGGGGEVGIGNWELSMGGELGIGNGEWGMGTESSSV